MKPLRIIHVLFGTFALVPLLVIGATMVLSVYQNADLSRVEGLQAFFRKELQVYHEAKGYYPDSLQALTFTNSPQKFLAQPNLRRTTYRRTDSGYELSCRGWWCRSTLSVSNNGAWSESAVTAR